MPSYLNETRNQFLNAIGFNRNISRGRGSLLCDDDGQEYLDFASQFGAVPFGHNPPEFKKIITEFFETDAPNMVQPFEAPTTQRLAANLIRLSPGDMKHVIFACSGTEAVEASLRAAAAATGRMKVMSTFGSYHGKTMGASLATGNDAFKAAFYPPNDDFSFVPYGDIEALKRMLETREFSCFIVEPVQGEGGVIVPPSGYLKSCQDICNQTGTLLIVDEIQTGLGRTGPIFACESEGVSPDIVLLSKALGAGMVPISATLLSTKAWSMEFGSRQSSTFGNYGLGCAIGLEVIKRLETDADLLKNISDMGVYLRSELDKMVANFPTVFKEARGIGLMQAVSLQDWQYAQDYSVVSASSLGFEVGMVSGFMLNAHNIITLPTLNTSRTLRIQPQLNVNAAQIDKLIAGLRDVASRIKQGLFEEVFGIVIGFGTARNTPLNEKNDHVEDPKPIPAVPSKVYDKHLGRFAFFMHLTSDEDIFGSLPTGALNFTAKEKENMLAWRKTVVGISPQPAVSYRMPKLMSQAGGYVDGCLIGSFRTPYEMMRLPRTQKRELMAEYMRIAKQENATFAGLGAYTSVISRAGLDVPDYGIPFTTGNGFTALTATDALRQLLFGSRKTFDKKRLGVIGAAGSVGRLSLLDIGGEFDEVVLIGNPRNGQNVSKLVVLAGEFMLSALTRSGVENLPLAKTLQRAGITLDVITDWIQEGGLESVFDRATDFYDSALGVTGSFPISVSNDVERALQGCNGVITATSNGESFLSANAFEAGAVIVDVARPSDLSSLGQERRDITIFAGGLVTLPEKRRFGRYNIVGLETGVSLACLSETIILAMAGVQTNTSFGGVSLLDEARNVFKLGVKHGFSTYLPSEVLSEVNGQ